MMACSIRNRKTGGINLGEFLYSSQNGASCMGSINDFISLMKEFFEVFHLELALQPNSSC